jgi:hypothetical protein
MKKLYVLFFTVLIYSITQAQIKKGEIVLGGNLGYSDQSYSTDIPGTNSNSTKTLSIGTSFGKAIKDNLVLGADISYDHSSSSYTPGTATTGNGFDAGVFLRKYKPLGAGFYLFGETKLSGNYLHNSTPEQPGSQPTIDVTDSYGFVLTFFPGLAYALSPKWQLEAELPSLLTISYSHSIQTLTYTGQPDETFKSHYFSASSFTGANFVTAGVRYFIGN